MTYKIEAATSADLAHILALLERSGLPQAGLQEHLSTTLVARSAGELVGCAALELYGTAALLRSVAVDASLRGQGAGQQLTRAALDLARQHGAATIYLLTETAGEFFPRFGFQLIERQAVAPEVQQSVEFVSACPDSALAMVARLAPRPAWRARGATPDDAPVIAHIYNQGIEDRIATFETQPRSEADVRAWFDSVHPVVVVEDNNQVVSFA